MGRNHSSNLIDYMNDKLRGKRVVVVGVGYSARGILRDADMHMNVHLADAYIKEDEKEYKVGRVILRGATVKYIIIEDLVTD